MLETDRILLRRWNKEDVEDLYEYAQDPEVGPNAGWKPHESKEESSKIIEMFLKGNEYAIVYKEDEKVIGSFGIMKDYKRRIADAYTIGYVLAKPYWNKGIMSELLKIMIPYIFEQLGAQIISVSHFPFNERSKRVIEKAGFNYEGCLRYTYQIYNGKVYDEMTYSLLLNEYLVLKEQGLYTSI